MLDIKETERRRKISLKMKGRIFSEEHCKNLSKSNKGRKHSEEVKKKINEGFSFLAFSLDTLFLASKCKDELSKARGFST